MALYLFTDKSVDEIEFDGKHPGLFLCQATREWEIHLRDWNFPQKNVYYIGSYQGCGCGWAQTGNDAELDEADIAAVLRDRTGLLALLRGADFSGARLVMCWEGEQGEALRGEETLTAETLCDAGFVLDELVAYRLA